MSTVGPERPPSMPSSAQERMWREVCNFGKVLAKRALKQDISPTIVFQSRQSSELSAGWSILDNQPIGPNAYRTVEQRGLMVHQSGQLAVYRALTHPSLMILNYRYNQTPNIDEPPGNSALFLSPYCYPQPSSYVHQLTYLQKDAPPIVGIPAIEHAEMLFETKFL